MTQSLQAGVVGLQALLGLTVVEAVRRRDVSAALNALVALVAALLPFGLQFLVGRGTGAAPLDIGSVLPFWIATAGLVHAIGMLGRYDTTWWWDHLAHGISAGLVAALVYAALIVLSTRPGTVPSSTAFVKAATVLVVMVAGVAWEVLELVARTVADRYGIDPLLVNYGWRDTAFDLMFDLVGAVIVIGADLRVFVPIADYDPAMTELVLVWSLGALLVGTVVSGLGIGIASMRETRSG